MSTPREIVDGRLAKGEIDLEEHAQIIALLGTKKESLGVGKPQGFELSKDLNQAEADLFNSDSSTTTTEPKKSNKWLWALVLIGVFTFFFNDSVKNYHASNCVASKISSYDSSNIDYRNKCNYGINVRVCENQVALEVFSFFDQKDRTRCRNEYIEAGKYIDNFYGSNENSSFLRKAISTSKMLIGACKPPVWPRFTAERKVLCPSPSK